MPLIDVSDLLSDPDFATIFDVVRSTETVSGRGRASDTTQTFPGIIGVVTPARGYELSRVSADGETLSGSINVHTTFRLTSGKAALDADIVVWPAGSNRRYTVVLLDDLTEFGAGFVRATCELLPLNP